jgi:beta-lactamase superfamily II metal-dependent hydrolase
VRALFALAVLTAGAAIGQQAGDILPAWQPGMLDIHQIQTGRGNSAFFVLPDGTTLMLDAGAVPERPGPQLGPPRPDGTRSPGEWIADYIRQFSPSQPPGIDYAVVTHYHDDHIAGLAQVARLVPIRTLIDRGETPAPMAGPLIDRYREFRKSVGGYEVFRPGFADQIVAAGVEIRNIAANGVVWTGKGNASRTVFPAAWNRLPPAEQPGENELSIALRITYGRFRYYTGGDLPGLPLDGLPAWHDLETPVAQAVGRVDVAVLDHHGWLDTTNAFFLQTLRPRVIVIPAWHATHPDHGVLRRIISQRIYPGPRDIFTTTLLDAPRAIFSYLPDPFQSTEGHIVVRVKKGGGEYSVYVLDDRTRERHILSVHGPYPTLPD